MQDENRHDKSLVEDKFHVEVVVVEKSKDEGPGLNAARWRVVRTGLCRAYSGLT